MLEITKLIVRCVALYTALQPGGYGTHLPCHSFATTVDFHFFEPLKKKRLRTRDESFFFAEKQPLVAPETNYW
jgi:hypothetical protein